jgi:hypothetical protein
VARALSFDPFSRDADKQENQDQAGLAIDGNRAS